MDETIEDSDETALQLGLRYFRDRVGDDIVSGRKTLYNGVVGVKYQAGKDRENDPEEFEDSQEILQIKNVQMTDLRDSFMDQLSTSTKNERDVFGAFKFCTGRLTAFCKKLKYIKTIVVITDGKAPLKRVDDKPIIDSELVHVLVTGQITVKVLGIGFSDDGDTANHTYSDKYQKRAEQEWRRVCDEVHDKDPDNQSVVVGSTEIYQALQNPNHPRTKAYKLQGGPALLSFGDQKEKKNSFFEISVVFYSCLRRLQPASGTLVHETESGKLEKVVRVLQSYRPNPVYRRNKDDKVEDVEPDPDKDDRLLPVDDSELTDGYVYGRELVPVRKDVEMYSAMSPGFQIIGTAVMEVGQDTIYDRERLQRWYFMSPTDYVIPTEKNEEILADFRARVHALKRDNMCYIAYFCRSADSEPRMVALFPFKTEDPRNVCLLLSDLPFSQDVRPFEFPSLLHPRTRRGKPLPAENDQLPNDEMVDLMRQVVDKMNLMNADQDEDGTTEWASPWDVCNPLYHRVKQVLKYKAVEQDKTADDIPEMLPVHTAYQHPPRQVMAACEDELQKLAEMLSLSKVEKASSIAEKRKADQELGHDNYKARKSGLNINDIL